MRPYTESDMYIKMNNGNSIYNGLATAVRSISGEYILNTKITENLETLQREKAYRETITLKAVEDVKKGNIILVHLPVGKRFPANIPYIKTTRQGIDCVIVDMSKYTVVKRDDVGNIIEASCDVPKLYAMLIPAYVALHVLNDKTILSTETTKWMAYLWAKLFNKILIAQRIFTGNSERYEAFMYFAMKFFMIYYLNTPMGIVDKITEEFFKGVKSKYILTVEANLQRKGIDLYKDWSSFAHTMFSNEITGIYSTSSVSMNTEQYVRLYSSYMGKDGAYLALWSADYFFYCLFVTYRKAYILNDRAWDAIVSENPKIMPRILSGIYKEI